MSIQCHAFPPPSFSIIIFFTENSVGWALPTKRPLFCGNFVGGAPPPTHFQALSATATNSFSLRKTSVGYVLARTNTDLPRKQVHASTHLQLQSFSQKQMNRSGVENGSKTNVDIRTSGSTSHIVGSYSCDLAHRGEIPAVGIPKSLRRGSCIFRKNRHTENVPTRRKSRWTGFCRFLPHLRRPFFLRPWKSRTAGQTCLPVMLPGMFGRHECPFSRCEHAVNRRPGRRRRPRRSRLLGRRRSRRATPASPSRPG